MTEISTFKCNNSSFQSIRIQNANRNISWIFQRHQAVNVNSEPPPQQRKAIVLKIPFTLDKSTLKLVNVHNSNSLVI